MSTYDEWQDQNRLWGAAINPAVGSYLIVDEIKGVAPLDSQFGQYPVKTVPDVLMGPLFGEQEPTDSEIKHYGSKATVPDLKTYIVLDAAKLQFGFSEIENCALPFQCLFNGKAAEELADTAPYLVELSSENSFTRRLLTYIPDVSANMTSLHLWQKEPGIYIRSRAELDGLRAHLRKFTKLYSKQTGTWTYFRFYDPEVLRGMIAHFNESQFESFGKLCHSLLGQSEQGGMLQIYRRNGKVPLIELQEDNEYAELL